MCVLLTMLAAAQSVKSPATAQERIFPQSKAAVEKALQQLQPALSGKLPTLEGFAQPGEHPLGRYQRAFFQSAAQVTAMPSGGSLVRVTTKVTAWYADSTGARSGYQVLPSNGRLESDLLDQLTDLLAARAPAEKPGAASASSAPLSSLPDTRSSAGGHPFSFPGGSALARPSSVRPSEPAPKPALPASDPATRLREEATTLEEALKSLAHPGIWSPSKNRHSGRRLAQPQRQTAFSGHRHDEFEMLDFSADWVHVRVSGLSRGWIWRTGLEMPEGISDIPSNDPHALPVAADLFQVSREETAPFPGDWEPLRGKSVKIISVQKIQENDKDTGAQAKLAYAKSLFDKNYAELAAKSRELAGVVLIFDSIDGGMIAATLPTVQQWKKGALSDAALWHQCYFDPPETFTVSGPSGAH